MPGTSGGEHVPTADLQARDPDEASPVAFQPRVGSFVVVEELIPESQTNGNADLATLGLLLGFALMMALDVALS